MTIFLVYCKNEGSQNNKNFVLENDSPKHESEKIINIDSLNSEHKDTLFINKAMAIFISPDSIEIKKIFNENKNLSKEDIYTVMDDLNYYTYEADLFLKENNIEILYSEKHIFGFIKSGGKLNFIRKDNLENYRGLIFFKPDSTPILVDLIDFNLSYFE